MQGITQRSFDIALRAAQDDGKGMNDARGQKRMLESYDEANG